MRSENRTLLLNSGNFASYCKSSGQRHRSFATDIVSPKAAVNTFSTLMNVALLCASVTIAYASDLTELFTLRASAKSAAPALPMLFFPKLNCNNNQHGSGRVTHKYTDERLT
jgi:hypothetical protein